MEAADDEAFRVIGRPIAKVGKRQRARALPIRTERAGSVLEHEQSQGAIGYSVAFSQRSDVVVNIPLPCAAVIVQSAW